MSLLKATSASLCSVVDTWEAVVSLPVSSEPQAESPSPTTRMTVSAFRTRMLRWVDMRVLLGVGAGGWAERRTPPVGVAADSCQHLTTENSPTGGGPTPRRALTHLVTVVGAVGSCAHRCG